MTITACTHGMGYPAACIDCMAAGPCPTSTGVTVVPELEPWRDLVRYIGHCPGCFDRIEPGDTGLGGRHWYCEECSE